MVHGSERNCESIGMVMCDVNESESERYRCRVVVELSVCL